MTVHAVVYTLNESSIRISTICSTELLRANTAELKLVKKFREQNPRYYRRYLLERTEKRLWEESRKWYRNNLTGAALYYSRHAEKRQQSLEQSLPERQSNTLNKYIKLRNV